MQRKLLIIVLLTCLLTAGCGLHTGGEATVPQVWIDAPKDGDFLKVNLRTAIMAHTNVYAEKMLLRIDDVGVGLLDIHDYGNGLWEGRVLWTFLETGDFDLQVLAATNDGDIKSDEISVEVVETSVSPMLFETTTPSPLPTPTVTATPWPQAQANFWADSLSLMRGGCTILHWDVAYATSVYLNDEFVAQQGSRQVCPQETTTYTLHVEAPVGKVDQPLTITVIQPTAIIPPPIIITPSITPTAIIPPPIIITPSITPPSDTSGPSLTNVSHSPDSIFDGITCGPTSATISVSATDPSGISKVELYYRVVKSSQQGQWQTLIMSATGGGIYQAKLGTAELSASLANYSPGNVEYYVKAWDSRGNPSQSGSRTFEVRYCLI